MKPLEDPVPNHAYQLGVFYDWVHGGHDVDRVVYGTPHFMWETMPVNQVNKKSKSGNWTPGGDWLSVRTSLTNNSFGQSKETYIRPGYGRCYAGGFTQRLTGSLANYTNVYSGYVQDKQYLDSLLKNLDSYGVEGFKRARPDAPLFSFANSLYELREVPKMLKEKTIALLQAMYGPNPRHWVRRRKARRRWYNRQARRSPDFMRRVSDDYLAIELGWIPLYSDIKNFIWAFNNLDRRLKDLLRNAGKPVRRKRDLREAQVTSRTISSVNHGTPWNPNIAQSFVTQCYANSDATTVETEDIYDEIYFIGQFRYTLPKLVKTKQGIRALGYRMMGIQLDPLTLWNALPWSWLADYFTNLGDTIDSLLPSTVAEGTRCDWAYVVRRKTVVYTRTCTAYMWGADGREKKVTSKYTMTHTIKSRRRVHPFGVASPSQLTPRQSAILLALGPGKW